MWARLHKIDRIRPQPNGSAIVLVEDERNLVGMNRSPGLSTVIAIARILNAKRALAAKYGGKGEVRYATNVSPPQFLSEAITRAGAAVADATGEHVRIPAMPAGVSAVVDGAFSDLAHELRSSVSASDMPMALKTVEGRRRKQPLDRETDTIAYWTSVFELAALAGELSRSRGGRWIETTEVPVPFVVKFADGGVANPAKLAQRIVEGGDPVESMATDVT